MLSSTIRIYKNAFAGLSKETWLLSFIMLVNRSGTMVVPFMSLYLTDMGISIGRSGFVIGFFGAGAFSGAWLGGKLTDKLGFYPIQLFTLTVGGLLFIVLGQMRSYELICLFTFLLSFVNEAFRPANSTAIAFYSKEENRTRSYALNRLAINLGWAVGSSLGGFIAAHNYELLFWVDGATNIIAAIIMWLFLKPIDYKPAQNKQAEKTVTAAHKDGTYMRFIFITFLFACCFFQLFNNLPVFFHKELHLNKEFIGLLMASNGVIIALFEMVIIYQLEGRRERLLYITAGVVLCGLSFFLLALPVQAALVAICMITTVTFGEILSMPFMNSYWIGRTTHTNRGQYAALYTMAWSAAQVLGPVGGAQVAEHFSFTLLWLIVGSILCMTAFSFYQLRHR
jgi:predicted MFS family arabinose efflux permease